MFQSNKNAIALLNSTVKKVRSSYGKVKNEDNISTLSKLKDNTIDLVVTSPPYGQVRNYDGNCKFNFEETAELLYKKVKQGGVICWNVQDSTIKGSKTGTSFKQALYFMSIGFNLHDVIIWEKNSSSFPARKNGNRYTQIFEYIFVLSKGKPATVNLICDKKNKYAGQSNWGKKTHRGKNDKLIVSKSFVVADFSPRTTIWKYVTASSEARKYKHPAMMPLSLAKDLILTFSNENDLIYDPFAGSGTTGKAAKLTNRKFLLSEKNFKYIPIIKQKLKLYDMSKIMKQAHKLRKRNNIDMSAALKQSWTIAKNNIIDHYNLNIAA